MYFMGVWTNIKNELRALADITNHIDTGDAALRIKNNIWFRGPNVWILAFSIVVASVGLNINSTAVIIGAMLISPLMGPIVGAGFALGTQDMPLLKQAGWNLLVMVIISLLASSLFFLISPLQLVNPTELEARTSPTIYDVLIALFGGLAGIFETSRKDRGTVLSGVAIATALMPPLCTAGYGLAHLNWHFFLGAMYLFTINGVFIALATYAVVRFLRFPQAQYLDEKKAKRQRALITVIVLAVLVPSVLTAIGLIQINNFERKVLAFVTENRTVGQHYIYDYDVDNHRQVEIFLTGDPLTEAERETFLASAERNGIPRDHIILNEHPLRSEPKEKEDEVQSLVQGLFEQSVLEIARKEERIRELEAQIRELKGDTTALTQEPAPEPAPGL